MQIVAVVVSVESTIFWSRLAINQGFEFSFSSNETFEYRGNFKENRNYSEIFAHNHNETAAISGSRHEETRIRKIRTTNLQPYANVGENYGSKFRRKIRLDLNTHRSKSMWDGKVVNFLVESHDRPRAER